LTKFSLGYTCADPRQVYHTALEREGHELQLPVRTKESTGPFGLDGLLDTLGSPGSLLDWLLPGQITPPDTPAEPSPEAAAVPSYTASDLSSTPTTFVSSTSTQSIIDSPISSTSTASDLSSTPTTFVRSTSTQSIIDSPISSTSEIHSAADITTSLKPDSPASTFVVQAPQGP
jgi:hypothetical protein